MRKPITWADLTRVIRYSSKEPSFEYVSKVTDIPVEKLKSFEEGNEIPTPEEANLLKRCSEEAETLVKIFAEQNGCPCQDKVLRVLFSIIEKVLKVPKN